MKKTVRIILVQIFLLVFFGTNLFAAELWNGFTTDMSPNQVEQRCKDIFSNSYINHIYWNSNIFKKPYKGNLEHKNNHLPANEEEISCSPYTEEIASSAHSNIEFYFRNGRLFGIYIKWKMEGTKIISKAIETFGDKYLKDVCHNPDFLFSKMPDTNVYFWNLADKEVYFSYSSSKDISGSEQYIFDKKAIESYPKEVEHQKKSKEMEKQEMQRRIDDNTIL